MSHEATSWAIKQRGLKPATKIVLFYLADRHNPDHGCFPSQKTLADDAEMSERSVRDHLDVLEAKGLIARATGHSGGQFKSNRYLLAFEADFQRQNLPSAKSASGENASAPTAKSAADRRQDLPTNLVTEPCNGTRKKSTAGADAQVPQPKKTPKRATTIPEGWMPSDRNIADARDRQFNEQEIHDEAERFRDYHLAKGTAFKDWDAGWRTWLGNARKYGTRRPAGRQQPSSGEQLSGLAGAAMRRRNARQQGYEGQV